MTKDVVKLVTFKLGEDRLAFPIEVVERVLRYSRPNPVPDAEPWIAGVVEQDGRIIPVVDLGRRLSRAAAEASPDRRVVVVRTSMGLIGLVVDAVLDVIGTTTAKIEPPPSLPGLDRQFLRGFVPSVGDDPLIVILDVERILSSEDRIVLDHIAFEGSPRV